jgi:hypothetical protein
VSRLQARADLGQIFFEPLHGAFAHRNEAILPALAAANVEGAPLDVEVGKIKAAEFRAAQPAGVKEFEDRAVTKPKGIGHVRDG